MVLHCGIEVELVEAKTKIPFKEHVHPKEGITYVEVEPDNEYFIRIVVISDDPERSLVAKVKVDGKPLRFRESIRGQELLLGLLETKIQDGLTIAEVKSFEFTKVDLTKTTPSLPQPVPRI